MLAIVSFVYSFIKSCRRFAADLWRILRSNMRPKMTEEGPALLEDAIRRICAADVKRLLRKHPEWINVSFDPFQSALFLFYEAVLRIKDKKLWTPDIRATLCALLEAGANVHHEEEFGCTVYDMFSRSHAVRFHDAGYELLCMLLNWGATPPPDEDNPSVINYIASRSAALARRKCAMYALIHCLRERRAEIPRGVDAMIVRDAALQNRCAWEAWLEKNQ